MIEVTGLRVVLPPTTVALDGVDLSVRAGEFVVILGSSGAGKTTLLRALNRLVEPTHGTVRINGRAVTGARPAELRAVRRQVGMIFQQFNLVRRLSVLDNVLTGRLGYVAPLASVAGRFPRAVRRQVGMIFQQFNLVRRLSVLDNVLTGRLGYVAPLASVAGRFPEADRRLARECLSQVGLAHLAERRADTLSGGEQQRVAIARALAQSPAVVLADEPTASLDPALTDSIMGALRRINVDRGLTLVVSQHQLATAIEYATRIVGFRAGRVVFDGRPVDVTPSAVAQIYAP